MGISTDAVLFYGYHLPEDVEIDEEIHELWGKEHKVLVGTHCSGEAPMYYVYIVESEQTARMGYPKQIHRELINSLLTEVWNGYLLEFAAKHEIPLPNTEVDEYSKTSEIGWWLVSYWGW